MAGSSLSDFDSLLSEAKEMLAGINLEKLPKAGVWKHREMVASSSINVTYPPLKILPPVDSGAKLFSCPWGQRKAI